MPHRVAQSSPRQKDTLAYAAFPVTRAGLLSRAHRGETVVRRQALGEWFELYHDAIRTRLLLRHGLRAEDAKDVAANFVAKAVEDGRVLTSYDRDGGSQFRSYLIASVDNFVRDWLAAGRRLKRGGDAEALSLSAKDAPDARRHVDGRGDSVGADVLFHRQCVRAGIDAVLHKMKLRYESAGEPFRWFVFDRLVLGPELRSEAKPSYAEVAAETGIASPSKVAGICTNAKRLFDKLLLEAEGMADRDETARQSVRRALVAEAASPAGTDLGEP